MGEEQKDIMTLLNKKIKTMVSETPFEQKKEKVNIISGRKAKDRDCSEEVSVREEVKVDGVNRIKTIITKKILMDIQAIVEPPKTVKMTKERKSRSNRKGFKLS